MTVAPIKTSLPLKHQISNRKIKEAHLYTSDDRKRSFCSCVIARPVGWLPPPPQYYVWIADCRSFPGAAPILGIAIHPANDGRYCETLNTGMSCWLEFKPNFILSQKVWPPDMGEHGDNNNNNNNSNYPRGYCYPYELRRVCLYSIYVVVSFHGLTGFHSFFYPLFFIISWL